MATEKVMILVCHKCDRTWTSPREVMDTVKCPSCGMHGMIGASNAKVIDMGKVRVLVPAQ